MRYFDYKGKQITYKDVMKMTGRCYSWVQRLLRRGFSIEQIIENGTAPRCRIYEYNGIKGSVGELLPYSKVSYSTLCTRLSSGWDIKDALERPLNDVDRKRIYEYRGKRYSSAELAAYLGRSKSWLYDALYKYKTIDELVEAGFNKKRTYEYNGVKGSLRSFMPYSKVKYSTLITRIHLGWDLKTALETEVRNWKE